MTAKEYTTKLRDLTEQFEKEQGIIVSAVEMDRKILNNGYDVRVDRPYFRFNICETKDEIL